METLPCNGMLLEYLSASPECAEVFRVWDRVGASSTHRLVCGVMRTLWCAVSFGPADVAATVSRLIIRNRMKALLSQFAGQNPAATAAVQALCAACVTVAPYLARDFLSRFPLTFKQFARHAKPSAPVDTEYGRVCLRDGHVALVSALLRCPSHDVLMEVLGAKGVVFSLLRYMGTDTEDTAREVTRVVLDRVLRNDRVPRRSKADLLSPAAVKVGPVCVCLFVCLCVHTRVSVRVPRGPAGDTYEGWTDPWALLVALKRAGIAGGARFVTGSAVGLEMASTTTSSSHVRGVRVNGPTGDALLPCDVVVNACGAWSAVVAKMAGIPAFPVSPKKRCVFVSRFPAGAHGIKEAPLVADPTGVYFRPEGGDRFVCLHPLPAHTYTHTYTHTRPPAASCAAYRRRSTLTATLDRATTSP